MMISNTYKIAPFITLVSVAHLVVDAACAFLLLSLLGAYDNPLLALLLYNGVAFALQALLGWLIDKWLHPKLAAMIGLICVASSFLFTGSLYVALMLFSLGNALYHVGAGSLVLTLPEKKATFSGIFVAPGALGLAIGTYLATTGSRLPLSVLPIILLVLCGLVYVVGMPAFIRIKQESTGVKAHVGWLIFLLILLILFTIFIRSLVGMSMDYPWKQNQWLAYGLLAAVFGGKVLGGVLADAIGLVKTGVWSLLLSTVLLSFFAAQPALAITGVFLFNFSMAVTLIAVLNLLPAYRGLSFGLTTVALYLGALPVLLGSNEWVYNPFMGFAVIMLSAITLFIALRYSKNTQL